MEKEILTPGQKAVIDGYLMKFEPTNTYDAVTCILIDTRTIIDDISPMCDYNQNTLADYLAAVGYRFHIVPDSDDFMSGISGWIFKVKS